MAPDGEGVLDPPFLLPLRLFLKMLHIIYHCRKEPRNNKAVSESCFHERPLLKYHVSCLNYSSSIRCESHPGALFTLSDRDLLSVSHNEVQLAVSFSSSSPQQKLSGKQRTNVDSAEEAFLILTVLLLSPLPRYFCTFSFVGQ